MSEAPSFAPDMQYDGNDIQHDAPLDDMLGDVQFTPDDAPLSDDENPYDEFLGPQAAMDEPDASLLEPRKRPPTAKRYEKKVNGLFSIAVKVTASSGQPALVADSAALLLHGPDISEKMGDLAASNARVARMIDMITDQTENPAAAVIVAALPAVLQVVRNHEPVIETEKPARTMRIPFTKRRLRFKVGFKLGKRMRKMTHDPVELQRHVFTNPKIQEALAKQGIIVTVE